MNVTRLKDIKLADHINNDIIIKGIISKMEVKQAKNGTSFADMTMKDMDCETNIKWFGFDEASNGDLQAGKVYEICVTVKPYAAGKDGISLTVSNTAVDKYKLSNEDISGYFNYEANVDWALNEVNVLLSKISTFELYPLVMGLLNDNYDRFIKGTAANLMHHTGIGGLLVHSASVASLALEMAEYMNKLYGKDFVNTSMVICGALLHDIGKIKELEFNTETGVSDYTNLSALQSHILIGIGMVENKACELGLQNKDSLNELVHIIASHHGKLEWGSAITPNTIEAKLVSSADDIDAYCNRFHRVFKDLKPGESFTEFKRGEKLTYFRSNMSSIMPDV